MDVISECEFWDSDKFWKSELPVFSPCLRNSLIRWIPSCFLIFGCLFQIKSYFKQYLDEQINYIYQIKRLIILLLILCGIIELSYFNNFDNGPIFILKTISSSVEILTYLIALLLFIRPRNKLRTSCILLLYSLSLLIFTITRVYSSICEYYRGFEYDFENTDNIYLIYLIIYLSIVLLFFMLNCLKDSKLPTDKINCPIYYSSFLSRATFSWMNKLIIKGFYNPIKEEELHVLHSSNKTKNLYDQFNKFYRKLTKKIEKQSSHTVNDKTIDINGNNLTKDYMKNGVVNNNYLDTESDLNKNQINGNNKINGNDDLKKDESSQDQYKNLLNKPPPINLIKPLIKTFWKEMIIVAIFRLVALCIQFINPLLLDFLLTYMSSDGPLFEGIVYGIGMFCVMLTFSLFNNQYEFRINVLGMKIRSVLTMAVYKKILVLSPTGRHAFPTGEIINLMATDCEKIFEFIAIANQAWACAFQIVVALAMIYYKLKLGFLGALIVLLIVIPWNTFITRKLKGYQSIEMKFKDDRVNLLSEILNGIKCLKLYAWEHHFKFHLLKIRVKELVYLKKKLWMQICMIQSYTLIPFMIIFFCLLLHILIYPDEVLDANKAFVTVQLVNILKVPLGLLPFVFSNGVMAKIAIKRINKFLSEDELNLDSVNRTNNSQTRDAISVKGASFLWDILTDTKPVLKKINMKVRRKQLVAVVGAVASGKSSLLAALLGEMHKIKGEVNINGSVAYVSQQAWTLNQTLKNNIVFGNEFDQKKYLDVLSRCQLLPDLKLLAAGDETEIGEKGINLSGGQKQRVNIARAVYADKDIYLFDDPLSALDSNVGKELFDKVISNDGLLKNKTRILVTHRVSLLPKVDRIIVLKNGMISEVGSYADLMNTKGDFAEFILQHLENEEFDMENIDNQEYQDMQRISMAVRTTMNLPTQQMNEWSYGSRPGSRQNSRPNSRSGSFRRSSFRRRRQSISSVKSLCLNHHQDQTCYNCVTRKRNESISSRKSIRRNSITSITKSFQDEFDRESILNDDDEDPFIDEGKANNKLIVNEEIKSGGIFGKACIEYLKEFNYFAFVMVAVCYTTAYVFNYNCSIWLSHWADDAKNPELAKDPANRDYRIGIYLLFGLLESTFVLFSMIILSRGCLKAAQNVHNIMLENISCSPSHYFDSTPLGRIVNRFAKDMEVLNFTIWMNTRSFFNSLLKAVISLLIVSTQAPTIMLFVVPLLIFYYLFQLVYIRTKRQMVRINFASKSPIYSIYQETINGTSCIRAFNLENEFENSCAEKIDQNSISFLPTFGAARWLTMRLELLGNIIVLICTIFMAINRDIINSPALVGLAITSALTINNSMNNFVRICSDLENNIVSIERCIEYTDLEKEDNVVDERNNLGKWPEEGNVKFIDYSTKYRPHLDFVLNNISFEINSNEKIGVVGRTGAGKSSLTLSLFRIIEAYNGLIEIDGKKIADLGLYELRSRLTIIPQEATLFTGSLRLNLDPLTQKTNSDEIKAHSDEALWKALEQAHLKEFVSNCPGGLDFQIQEGGENLSVGQRQMICLARALLRKSKILVLDEATSTVDLDTDELIQETIKSEFKNCTIITIAHRLNTILDYDKILVLDRGRIAEFDTVQNLLSNKNSIFYSMARDSGLVS